jgi:AcrR family transcriptional regulator
LVAATAASLPAGRREQTKARNRAVLLAAAHRVFATLGFDAASVRDIVRATDLSVGTFYQYFRDKDEVFAAVVEDVQGALRQRLREARRDRRLSFEQRIHAAYLAVFRFACEERPLFEVLHRNQGRLSRAADPGIGLALQELAEDLGPDLASGRLAREDPELVAAAMIGMGLMVARRLVPHGPLTPEEAADFCTRLGLRGLRPTPTLRRKSK